MGMANSYELAAKLRTGRLYEITTISGLVHFVVGANGLR
jgi:hypothetical protein